MLRSKTTKWPRPELKLGPLYPGSRAAVAIRAARSGSSNSRPTTLISLSQTIDIHFKRPVSSAFINQPGDGMTTGQGICSLHENWTSLQMPSYCNGPETASKVYEMETCHGNSLPQNDSIGRGIQCKRKK